MTAVSSAPGTVKRRVRRGGAEHHRGRRHRHRGVVVKRASRPQRPEALGEQVQRDEGDHQDGRPGDDRRRGRDIVRMDDTAQQDDDAERLHGRDEQQRAARDPHPGELSGGDRGNGRATAPAAAAARARRPARHRCARVGAELAHTRSRSSCGRQERGRRPPGSAWSP